MDADRADAALGGDATDVVDADGALLDAPDAGEPGADADVVSTDLPAPDAPMPLAPGELCVDDRDCDSGLCVSVDLRGDVRVCSSVCNADRDCPNAFRCVTAGGGVDALRVCLPLDLCVDEDGDLHGTGPGCLGADCDDALSERNASADERCDGTDNDCDGAVDERSVDAGAACDAGFAGVCREGTTVCAGGLLVCRSAAAASDERCDAADNDCDGTTDEGADGAPLSRPCYPGPDATLGVGVCAAGLERCVDGSFASCAGAIVPGLETCDGGDDDCDGFVDERPIDVGLACDTGTPGVCAPGTTGCADGELVCSPTVAASDERCDGADNDCDGALDEDVDAAPLSRTCYSGPGATVGVGLCTGGIERCGDAAWGRCEGEVLPTVELCNGYDDDCDGSVDEDASPETVCDTGVPGACAPGVLTCLDTAIVCVAAQAPVDERCDGDDNDCDGAVDEDADGAPLRRSCYPGPAGTDGVGECVAGLAWCADGAFGDCQGAVTPAADSCNGRNDDCDADGADEGNPGGGLACVTSLPGRCAPGVTRCSDGAIACLQLEESRAETCDNADEDCDGQTDEADAGGPLRRTCYTGAAGTAGVGACRAGAETCGAGAWGACTDQVTPVGETCNGVNDDCDPAGTDEGCPSAVLASGDAAGAVYGGGGGGSFSDTCPANQVLIGIDGRSASRLDRVAGVCGVVSLVVDTGVVPYRYAVSISPGSTLAAHGGGGGDAYSFRCPAGQVVTGVRGRYGAEVDAFGVNCSTLTVSGSPGSFNVAPTPASSSPLFGGSGGSPFSDTCGSGGVVRGLLGRSGTRVDAVGQRCGSVTATLR